MGSCLLAGMYRRKVGMQVLRYGWWVWAWVRLQSKVRVCVAVWRCGGVVVVVVVVV